MTKTTHPRRPVESGSSSGDAPSKQVKSVRMSPDTVVSRFHDGKIASRIGDLYWNWTPYMKQGREMSLSFNFWSSPHRYQSQHISIPSEHGAMVADMQHIMALVLFKRPGETYSYGILYAFLAQLKHMARLCVQRNLSLVDFLGDEKLLKSYGRKITSKSLARFSGLISILTQLDQKADIGFLVAGNPILGEVRQRVTDMLNEAKQTPPVPARIYSLLITTLERELADFDAISIQYLRVIKEAIAKRELYGVSSDRWKNATRDLLLADPDLNAYFEAKSLQKDPKGMIRGLNEVQILCKLSIQTFSGMRHSESIMLPFHCIETERRNGRTHYILCGVTTKYNKGKIRRTKWVTFEDAHRAASVARKIAKFVYASIDIVPGRSLTLVNKHPLFVSTSYLGFGMPRPSDSLISFKTKSLQFLEKDHPRLRKLLCPIISVEDLDELDAIDPVRAWREEEEFQVGHPWPLETHQLRRSLALYAQRSGLVSLPSLKRQLQHITREMSRYYTKGSVFAVNFIDGDPEAYLKHVARDWREAKPLSEALAFLRDVVFCDEQLFGGAGAFEQGKKDRGEASDRQVTLARFRLGEIAYRETALGGCIKLDECSQVGLKILDTACLSSCVNMVGKISKLDSAIRSQESLVTTLDPDSVEFRMEGSDLAALRAARAQWQDASARRGNVKRP